MTDLLDVSGCMLGEPRQWNGLQFNQSGNGRTKTALHVELGQVGLEIHMQPMSASLPCQHDRLLDETRAQSATVVFGIDGRIENRSVLAAVPGNVDETDQARGPSYAHR